MIYELRVYTAMPVRLPDVLARFQQHTIKIWERLGIHPVAFFTPLVAADSNELTYLLAWKDLADREAKWGNFVADPAWIAVREDSEREGPIVARMANSFVKPTSFSDLK